MVSNDWITKPVDDWSEVAAKEIIAHWPVDITDEQRANIVRNAAAIIRVNCPFKRGVAYEEVKPR